MSSDETGGGRMVAAFAMAAAVATLAAFVLGEYDLSLGLGVVAGALLGSVVGEIVVVGRRRGTWVAAALAATVAAAGILWAGEIGARRSLEEIRPGAWAGAGLAAVVAGSRVAAARSRDGAVTDPGRPSGGAP